MKALRTLVSTSMLAVLSSQALAAEVPTAPTPPSPPTFPSHKLEPIPAGSDEIISVKKGEPAPITGQLFSPPTALRWGHYIEQAETHFRLDPELYQKLFAEQSTYYVKLLAYEQARSTAIQVDLTSRLAQAEYDRDHPPWYRTTEFGITIGVVGTLSLVGLVAYGFHKLN